MLRGTTNQALTLGRRQNQRVDQDTQGHHAVTQNKCLLLVAAKTKELARGAGLQRTKYECARDKTMDTTSDTQQPKMATRP